MNTKIKLSLAMVVLIAVGMVVNFILGADVGIDSLVIATNQINTAKALDTEAVKNEAKNLSGQLDSLNKEYADLSKTLTERQDEYIKIMNEDPTSLKTQLGSSLMYTKIAEECNRNATTLDRFYNIPVNGKDTYTVTLVGTLTDLNSTLEGLRENLNSWNITIGNYSLRQNYDAYDLKRTYDQTTRLSWYDNKLVNAFGEVMDLDVIYGEDEEDEDGKKDNSSETTDENGEKRKSHVDYDSPEFKYGVASLNEVKMDEEGMKVEITASNSEYEKRIADLVKSYGTQLDVLDKAGYDATVREEIRMKLDTQYENDLSSLKTAKEAAANTIKLKYEQKYERDKQAAANMIGRYEDTIEELKKTLVDSSSIEYKLDLTMMYD